MDFLDSLNQAQREAATHIDGPLLILAGAGSGKTKTLTSRLCYLVQEVGIPAKNTLTLTFTNKAAKEMNERAMALLNNQKIIGSPLLCTFHRFGLLFLRKYMEILKRSNDFNIIDESDKKKIIKDIKKQHSGNKPYSVSTISGYISTRKNSLNQLDIIERLSDNTLLDIFDEYNNYLAMFNLIDFDDLLALPNYILRETPDLREYISKIYSYIMVDEYQDTNDLQVALLKKLCAMHDNICVVGDDDQSIYGWRGANVRNILEFSKDFNNAKTIKLEQNYRSAKEILDTANNLIKCNTQRHNKILIPIKLGSGEVTFLNNYDDKEELQKIIQGIGEYVSKGSNYGDIAILYRLNAMSTRVESALMNAKIPYKIIGSYRFYERQEIKDVMAYLRYTMNAYDEFSLSRIINQPKRSIGEKTFENLKRIAGNLSIQEAFSQGLYNDLKCCEKLRDFFMIIQSLRDCISNNPMELPDIFNRHIKLYYDDDVLDPNHKDGVDNAERRQNVREFFSMLNEYIYNNADIDISKGYSAVVLDFLANVSLSSGGDEDFSDSIICMSIHNSKGLEFKHVFVIGLEHGLFPLHDDPNEILEERRLAYVAFTRAKDTLTLSYCKHRIYRGHRSSYSPSIFLRDCGVYTGEKQENDYANTSTDSLNIGDCVKHKVFGLGRIISIQGDGEQKMATINFGGTKRVILLSFLEKI